MRRPDRILPVFLLLALCASCEDASESRQSTADDDGREQFATYARNLFAELRAEPLDSTLQTGIGLFGEMSVGAGENVVMRQYRYRVDSSDFGPVAHMAFHIRDGAEQYGPVPIVLTFVARHKTWGLERAVFGDAVYGVVSDSMSHGHDHTVRDPSAAQAQSPLHQRLRARLDAWLGAALSRVDASEN